MRHEWPAGRQGILGEGQPEAQRAQLLADHTLIPADGGEVSKGSA